MNIYLSLVTQLYGSPVAPEALMAQSIRNEKGHLNYQSVIEVLLTYGFDNTLSKRSLKDIPTLSVPVVIILHNEEAAVIVKIEGSGKERQYQIRQTDGLEHTVSGSELEQKYLGYCWFIKPKVSADVRSELPEYHMPKS